jgi:hypothetical protein
MQVCYFYEYPACVVVPTEGYIDPYTGTSI